MPRLLSSLAVSATLCLAATPQLESAEFQSDWPAGSSRVWVGQDYWANPLQDWRLRNGLLECHVAGGDRNVHLLTREIAERAGNLELSVTLGRLAGETGPLGEGFVGFRVGIRGAFDDYRDSAVRGAGLNAGISGDGRLFIGTIEEAAPKVSSLDRRLALRLSAEPAGEVYEVTLTATHEGGASVMVTRSVPGEWLVGGMALVCSSGEVWSTPTPPEMLAGFGQRRGTERGGAFRFWFHEWRVAGSKLDSHPERAFGPILYSLHTLSRGTLGLTAQLVPLDDPSAIVSLEVQEGPDEWVSIATAPIDPLARTAHFRIAEWDDSRDVPYRVVLDHGGARFTWEGTVRRDPVDKDEIVVAAFTGNNDLGFPHADVVRNVRHFAPDLLAFTGDNIYERVADYGIERSPLAAATLDYLRKWYLFGWEYRELLRDIPAIVIADDHDVYHGNIWGAGGRAASPYGPEGQDKGGFTMAAPWVNMVQRTQTSHMPTPPDATPVEQGIGVYYAELLYGGVSVAILEDRKWKSAPAVQMPAAKIVNGWSKNPDYDPATEGDVEGAELLGPRQEQFLEEWSGDWSGGAWMKVVVSQTIFANVATLPPPADTDAVTPRLRIMQPGEYAEGESPVADHDSNGWPQTPRNRALRSMRKGLAFHIAGDQHLGSTIQYGIDEWNDASWAICVPSVANVFPRRWYPSEPGGNPPPDGPRYAGEFLDGFGNKITVHAVSNPIVSGAEPAPLFDRAPGYGIVTFHRDTRRIVMANWPRWVDVTEEGAEPYPVWPITIQQTDNGLPRSGWVLPTVSAPGLVDPIVEVVDEASAERVYSFRIQGDSFEPPVPGPGTYSVRVFDPDRPEKEGSFKGLQAHQEP